MNKENNNVTVEAFTGLLFVLSENPETLQDSKQYMENDVEPHKENKNTREDLTGRQKHIIF